MSSVGNSVRGSQVQYDLAIAADRQKLWDDANYGEETIENVEVRNEMHSNLNIFYLNELKNNNVLDLIFEDVGIDGLKPLSEVSRFLREHSLLKIKELVEKNFLNLKITFKINNFSNTLRCISTLGLVCVDLSCSNFNDENVNELHAICPNLQRLSLAYTKITEAGLVVILKKKSQLVDLNCLEMQITGDGFADITEEISSLQKLSMEYTNLNDGGLASILEKCINLRQLNVAHTKITDQGFNAKPVLCTQLEQLSLVCTKITAVGFFTILGVFPKLHQLRFRNPPSWGDKGADIDILEKYPDIRQLDLEWLYDRVDVVWFNAIFTKFLGLKQLSIEGCTKVPGTIGELTELQQLNLRITLVDSAGIANITRKLTNLLWLNIAYTLVGSPGIVAIGQNCPNLQWLYVGDYMLNFGDIPRITLADLTTILDKCPSLHIGVPEGWEKIIAVLQEPLRQRFSISYEDDPR